MIKIISVGKLKEDYLKEAVYDYIKRLNKYHKVDLIELIDTNMKNEGEEILKHLNKKDYIIALSIEGKQLSSLELANKIEKTFINYPNITFIIGGSNGIREDIKKEADFNLSFSKLTFPHGLFRIILLEQIYRTFKIINNESYHK